MKPQKQKLTIILAALLIGLSAYSVNAQARQPAVDPVIGLSIDEYREVPPEQAQGFEFSEVPTASERAMASEAATPQGGLLGPTSTGAERRSPGLAPQVPSIDQAQLESAGTQNLPTIVLLLALLALPFASWWFVHRRLSENENSIPSNTIDLWKHQKEKAKKDDYPKAS